MKNNITSFFLPSFVSTYRRDIGQEEACLISLARFLVVQLHAWREMFPENNSTPFCGCENVSLKHISLFNTNQGWIITTRWILFEEVQAHVSAIREVRWANCPASEGTLEEPAVLTRHEENMTILLEIKRIYTYTFQRLFKKKKKSKRTCDYYFCSKVWTYCLEKGAVNTTWKPLEPSKMGPICLHIKWRIIFKKKPNLGMNIMSFPVMFIVLPWLFQYKNKQTKNVMWCILVL